MNNLPNGTVTFLFTDIEGSTKLAQQYPAEMPSLLARHNEILNHAIKAHNGFVFRVVGDSFSAAFHNASDALNAALDTQRLLHNEPWSSMHLKVRMGIHTGDINQARKIYNETIKGWQDVGNRAAIAHQLECFALICVGDEEPQRAIRLFGAAEALREKTQSPMTEYEQIEYDQSIDQLRTMLAETEFTALRAEGRALTMEQAIQFALE